VSIWEQEHVLDRVLGALASVPNVNDEHHFGRAWLTAYQLGIKVDAAAPQLKQALGVAIGGLGTGSRTSLSQYIARELPKRIRVDAGGNFPVRGAFLSNERIRSITYDGPCGMELTSSASHSGYDLSLFQLVEG
jgi:hypothetical protein